VPNKEDLVRGSLASISIATFTLQVAMTLSSHFHQCNHRPHGGAASSGVIPAGDWYAM
jgi:hypothetical protein